MDSLPAGQLSFLLTAGSAWHFTNTSQPQKVEFLCRCQMWPLWRPVSYCSSHSEWMSSCPKPVVIHLEAWQCAQEIWCICETPALYWRNAIYWPPMFESSGNPDSTIPFNLLVTTARPDMVYICNNTLVLIELTIPFNSPECLNRAQSRKQT